jgi:hypothetical protein
MGEKFRGLLKSRQSDQVSTVATKVNVGGCGITFTPQFPGKHNSSISHPKVITPPFIMYNILP